MAMNAGPPPNFAKPHNKQYTEEALSEARLIKGCLILDYREAVRLQVKINSAKFIGKKNPKDMLRFQAAVQELYLNLQMKPEIQASPNFVSFGKKVDNGEKIPHLELCEMLRAIGNYGQKIGIFKFEFVKSVNAGWDFNEDEITADLQ